MHDFSNDNEYQQPVEPGIQEYGPGCRSATAAGAVSACCCLFPEQG